MKEPQTTASKKIVRSFIWSLILPFRIFGTLTWLLMMPAAVPVWFVAEIYEWSKGNHDFDWKDPFQMSGEILLKMVWGADE